MEESDIIVQKLGIFDLSDLELSCECIKRSLSGPGSCQSLRAEAHTRRVALETPFEARSLVLRTQF